MQWAPDHRVFRQDRVLREDVAFFECHAKDVVFFECHTPPRKERWEDQKGSKMASSCQSVATSQTRCRSSDGWSSQSRSSWSRATSPCEAAHQAELEAAIRSSMLQKEIADLMAFEGIDVYRKGAACADLVEVAMGLLGDLPPSAAGDLQTYAETQMEQVEANLAGLIVALRPDRMNKVLAACDASVCRRVARQFRTVKAALAFCESESECDSEDETASADCDSADVSGQATDCDSVDVSVDICGQVEPTSALSLRTYVNSVVAEAAADLAGLATALLPELPPLAP